MNAAKLEKAARLAREQILREWDADRRPISCPNCRHCVVFGGPPDDPLARCAKGYGPAKLDLVRMLRPKAPRQFTPAKDCADFESMSDGTP